MSFYPIDGEWKVKYFRKKASTAFAAGELVAFETNGTAGDPIEPADASDENIIGICARTVTSASSDYADNTRIPVLIPSGPDSEMEGAVTSGLVVADEGLLVDLTSSVAVNRAASSIDALMCTRFLSSTKGRFIINRPAWPREETYD